MNIVLWVLQALLALMFLMAGFMKTFRPVDTLAKNMTWVTSTPTPLVRFIGISELLGAIGLILPALVHILPVLVIAAAIGIAIIMVLAIFVHASRKEYSGVITNIVILAVAIFIAYGRIALAPF